MRSVAKSRSNGYKSITKNQWMNLTTTISAFKIEEYIDEVWKKELKDLIYYNYGYLFSKTKNEIYRVLNKPTANSLKND